MPINKETIISVFDEKLTLMQWLKTINKALEDAVLTGVEITKKGNATLSFKFTFEDGTFLETNDLVLQQGESVNGAYIQNGHLYLTLTNGTNLDAGNVKPVSNFSIDANQHLIVNYADGTSQDLGAIFNGNINVAGNLTITGKAKILEQITDANGNYRFIEGNVNVRTIEGVTKDYAKWSLSGTHLMIVIALTIEEGTTLNNEILASIAVPQWVLDKIYPLWGSNGIALKSFEAIDTNSQTQTINNVILQKPTGYLSITKYGSVTLSTTKSVRIQFDLLIDNE